MNQSENNLSENKPLSLRDKFTVWMPALLALMLACGIWVGFQLQPEPVASKHIHFQGTLGEVGTVEEVLRFIDAKYLEAMNREELEQAAIQGVLAKLDPHSNYISRKDLDRVNEQLEGNFEGVGIEFFVLNDTIMVVGVLPEGPAAKAGVGVGDKIITIEDTLVAGIDIDNEGVINQLKGKKGTSVRLGLLHPDGYSETIKVERGEIPLKSVEVAYMLNEKVGYIKISRFSGQTYKEFMTEMERLIESGMEDIVIDLRDNPGGYLKAATDILDQLFSVKELLVYTEGRSYSRREYKSKGRSFYEIGKIAILMNEGSASASEIMAGAIQDNDRGAIVGRRSFGKGLVQEQYDLSDGSALRLTVARYYTPSGRLIQKPYFNGRADYQLDLQNRYDSGELYSRDSIHLVDSTKYFTKRKRVVYGGGGIMPDVFVPLDTIFANKTFNRALVQVPAFVYDYANRYRSELQAYETLESFLTGFRVDAALMDSYWAWLAKKSIRLSGSSKAEATPILRNQMKALIGQQLFRESGFYRVLHQRDLILDKALNQLKERQPSAMRE